MRAREKSARSAVPRASPARPVVLLTKEGGASERWADAVVRGLLEVDFVRWSLGPGAANGYPGSPLAGPTPRNVVRSIRQPAWSDPPGVDPWGNGRIARRRRRPSPREVEGAFVPLLRAFLEATIDPAGPGERVAAALLDLRDAFRAWEPAVVWRSRGAWEAVRDHLLVRTPDAGAEDIDVDGDEVDGWSSDDLPTIGEAAQALSWLGRMLAPLTVEVPRVDLVHAASTGFSAIPGILARVERGTPLLLSEHGVAPREHYLMLRALGAPFHLKRLAADVSGAVARTAYRVADRMAPVTRHTMRWELAYG